MSKKAKLICKGCGNQYPWLVMVEHQGSHLCMVLAVKRMYQEKGMRDFPDYRTALLDRVGIAYEQHVVSFTATNKFTLYFAPAWAARILRTPHKDAVCLGWLQELSLDTPEQAARVATMSEDVFLKMMRQTARDIAGRTTAVDDEQTLPRRERVLPLQPLGYPGPAPRRDPMQGSYLVNGFDAEGPWGETEQQFRARLEQFLAGLQ